MGQMLGRSSVRSAAAAAKAIRKFPNEKPSSASVRSASAADIPARPPPPEPRPIVEPEQDLDEWNKNDPKFKALTQQIVGSITTRPAGKEAMGGAKVNPVRATSLPKDRSTQVNSGIQDAKDVMEGYMNIIQMKEMFSLHDGSRDEKGEAWDVKRLSERYKVDAEVLEKVLWNMALPNLTMPPMDDGDRISVWREPN